MQRRRGGNNDATTVVVTRSGRISTKQDENKVGRCAVKLAIVIKSKKPIRRRSTKMTRSTVGQRSKTLWVTVFTSRRNARQFDRQSRPRRLRLLRVRRLNKTNVSGRTSGGKGRGGGKISRN